jgi:sulfate adenylyltransferase subunit 1 (EFTu-like GTPase family)
LNRVTSAKLAGISKDTFYEWLKQYSDFSDAVELAEKQAIESLVLRINIAAQGSPTEKSDWKAGAWLLERIAPEDFVLAQKVKHEGTVKHEFVRTDVQRLARSLLAGSSGHVEGDIQNEKQASASRLDSSVPRSVYPDQESLSEPRSAV